jgi:hypothetical protein
MTKNEFKDKIKTLVKQLYTKTEKSSKIDLDSPSAVSLDSVRFPVLVKFPTLHNIITKLLTNQFDLFLKDIEWVAPRPTTFRIILANDQVFYLIYTDRTWIGKVEGKKYYLLNLGEEQNFTEALARILSYGAKVVVDVPTEVPVPETSSAPEDEAPKEPAAETPPAEETPPA